MTNTRYSGTFRKINKSVWTRMQDMTPGCRLRIIDVIGALDLDAFSRRS